MKLHPSSMDPIPQNHFQTKLFLELWNWSKILSVEVHSVEKPILWQFDLTTDDI